MKLTSTTDNTATANSGNQQRGTPFSIPKEIMIKTLEPEQLHHQVMEEDYPTMSIAQVHKNTTITPPSCSSAITGMDWEQSLEENQLLKEQPRFGGCVVSLPSSDCSSQDCRSLVSVDPLDYRKDWSKDLFETDLTKCIYQNPELFLLNEEKQQQGTPSSVSVTVAITTASDDNSLYSCLSEDYEMDADDNMDMTGLWDGEKHDISIPEWVSSQNRI